MIGMGFVEDWGSLAGLRVVLGIFEVGRVSVVKIHPTLTMDRQASFPDVCI